MRRNRLSENKKKNNSAVRLYPSLECFCTVLGSSSSSSSCFSQHKHRKPVRRCTALWPRNARNGSATLHHARRSWQHLPVAQRPVLAPPRTRPGGAHEGAPQNHGDVLP